jgi:tRNA pseudouridine38-40 synthase
MQAAADLFPGRHDFGSFCENAEGHDSTLVEVAFARLETPPEAPDLLIFRIGASHFLWKMVRRLTGTLVEVGTGRLGVKDVKEMLTTRTAKSAAWTSPPSGLFLESVTYPGDPPPPPIDSFSPGF